MNNIIQGVVGFLLLVAGINTIITKKLPQGKYGAWIEIGNFSYFLGITFMAIGIFMVYLLYRKHEQ